MKANTEIVDRMPDNADKFLDPFFKRFELRHAPQPLQLNERVTKNYRFPTLYSDVTCAIGIFMCDYQQAKAILPHPGLRPVRMTKGRSLVVFSCYEYKNVMNVLPYNEISMMIPVLNEPKLDLPILPMVAAGFFPSMGYYVFSMPVTSKENQLRGNKIWGLPKVTEDIDVTEDRGDCVTVAHDSDGAAYFELRVPMAGAPSKFDVSTNLYSKLENRFLTSRTNFTASFNVNKHMGVLFKKGAKPDRPYLKLGNSPRSTLLRGLEIEEQPFQFRYAKHMNAAFDLPYKVV
ncbi:MAG: acetoacetate decarboxylase family protein [Deltaproteobacteria bacterium]|nr:acetoacetate decarboxylase family protein [Deltaproteobacteria bacterium]